MKIHKVIVREDGTQIEIVAELFTNISQKLSIGNYVLERGCNSSNCVVYNDGRMFEVVTKAEVLRVNQELRDTAINNISGHVEFIVQ